MTEDRQVLEAPERARWAVQSIDFQQDKPVSKLILFYTHDLQLARHQGEWDTTYDPRQRNWYEQAMESGDNGAGQPLRLFH